MGFPQKSKVMAPKLEGGKAGGRGRGRDEGTGSPHAHQLDPTQAKGPTSQPSETGGRVICWTI